MRVRIGIDARQIENRRKLTGVGRYIIEICRGLHEAIPEAQFLLYGQSEVRMPLDSPRFIPRVEPKAWARWMKSVVWLKVRAGLLLRHDQLDAYWAASTLLPCLPRGLGSVSTVYDLNHLVVPESMPALTLWTHRLFFRRDVARSSAVVTISSGTALRIQTQLGLATDAVVRPAASQIFVPPERTAVSAVLDRYGIAANYLLAVGTLEPRKNLESLISAFLSLCEAGELPDHQLVLVGSDGWKNEGVKALIAANAGTIRTLGYVPDGDLPALYAGCRAFVFPSIYEGFGIPVLEARLCGARVVAADVPEIREACGESGYFVTPDVEGLKGGIRRSLGDTAVAVGATEVPSWREGAETLASIFRSFNC